MEQDYFKKLMSIVEKAGVIALDLIQNSSPEFKPDFSIVTKADKTISALVRKELDEFLKTNDHILIDEEDSTGDKYFSHELISQKPYIWISDPIDGTRNFSNRLPLYGISLGVLKNLRPWLGAVYFPNLKELYYCDGTKSYFVEQAFTENAKKTEIVSVDQEITKQSIFLLAEAFFKHYQWKYELCQILVPACAVADLCWPANGRAAGCMFSSYLWDFAGSWPICRSAGLEMRGIKSGKVLDRLELDFFVGKNAKTWRLNEYFLLSSPRNYSILKQSIKAENK